MLVGMFLFAANDTMGKWLVATYSVGQVLLVRSVVALIVLAPILWRFGLRRLVRVERPGIQALRVVFSTLEVFCFYWAVRFLPLADVMTYWLAVPLLVAALSPFLLKEPVGWRSWSFIAIGFVGVVIALDPAGVIDPWPMIVALIGMASFAGMMITGRSLRGTPDTVLVFWQIVGALVAGLVLGPATWVAPTAPDFALLGFLGVVAMLAHVCVNRALKLGDAALITPFQYTILPWAVVMGWLVFGDVPDGAMIAGAAVIVGSGIGLIWRKNARALPDIPG